MSVLLADNTNPGSPMNRNNNFKISQMGRCGLVGLKAASGMIGECPPKDIETKRVRETTNKRKWNLLCFEFGFSPINQYA